MIRVIVIDGLSQKLYELDMAPSHVAMEEEIGTRFWAMRRVNNLRSGCVFFHAEGKINGYEDFCFLDRLYMGSGLLCRMDSYGDLASTGVSIEDAARHVTFMNHVKP